MTGAARIVTALREVRGGVAVELDGERWRVLPTAAVVRAELRVGRALDRAAARELARELRRGHALAQATRVLRAGDRSRGAMEQRLARAGHSEMAREETLASLERAGLLDDERLARNRAETLARRGYGDAAIRADLVRRLVGREAVDEALAALEPESGRARRLLDAAAPTPALLRRLAARGFSRETLDDVVSSFVHDV